MSTAGSFLFAGNSRYAADFQAVIDRAVAIASLPVSQLKNERAALADQSRALTALDVSFTAVQTALAGVESAVGSTSYQAVLSGPEVAAVTLGAGAMEGSYSIEVTSLGAYSTAISRDEGLSKVTDPNAASLSDASSFTMKVNGVVWALEPAANTLTSLAASINASGAAVRATVVNVGSPAAPDYRLSLESTKLGAMTLELEDASGSLMEMQVTGSLASYKVNGVAQEAESDTRTVELAPGVTLQLKAASAPGEPTGITVTRQSSVLANALSSLATAYNSAMDELDKHRGEAGGALAGQQVIYSLSQSLRRMVDYTGGGAGAANSLTDLGFSFGQDGRLSFHTAAFLAEDLGAPGQVAAFLGSALEGGFLRAASEALDAAANPVWGRVRTELNSVNQAITRTDERIDTSNERLDQLRVSLQEQMAAADALIASLEQHYSYISTMLEAMRSASENYR